MFNNRPADVVQHLVLAVQTLIYMPKDYVIVKGEFGSEMFFIQSGKCDVIIEMPRAKKKDDDFVKIESSFQSINSMDSMMKVGKELFNRKQSQMVRMRAPTEKSGGSEESESGLEFEIVEKVVKELEKDQSLLSLQFCENSFVLLGMLYHQPIHNVQWILLQLQFLIVYLDF